ncbi:hypothetical protein DOLIC_00145 [Dolichomitus sp. PSUC_FEM 10030005]|nr:hypothetical protein [Dolichomitus sp. PSUC_FEM 10030005]
MKSNKSCTCVVCVGSGNKAGVLIIDERNMTHLLLRYYPYGKANCTHGHTDNHWREIYTMLQLQCPLKDAHGMEIDFTSLCAPSTVSLSSSITSRSTGLRGGESRIRGTIAGIHDKHQNHRINNTFAGWRSSNFNEALTAHDNNASTAVMTTTTNNDASMIINTSSTTSRKIKNNIIHSPTVYNESLAVVPKSKDNFFWEQLQIPRGSRNSPRETSIMAAFREFYEETGYLPTGRGTLCREYFVLKWIDDSVLWTYTIYLLYLDSKSLKYMPNNDAAYWSFQHAGGIKDVIKCNIQCSPTKRISRGAIRERSFFQHVRVVVSRYRAFMNSVFTRATDVEFHNYSGLFGLINDFTDDISNCKLESHYTIEFNVNNV